MPEMTYADAQHVLMKIAEFWWNCPECDFWDFQAKHPKYAKFLTKAAKANAEDFDGGEH